MGLPIIANAYITISIQINHILSLQTKTYCSYLNITTNNPLKKFPLLAITLTLNVYISSLIGRSGGAPLGAPSVRRDIPGAGQSVRPRIGVRAHGRGRAPQARREHVFH